MLPSLLLVTLAVGFAPPEAPAAPEYLGLPPYVRIDGQCPQLAEAQTAIDRNNFAAALKLLQHAQGDYPQLPSARMMTARILMQLRRVPEARAVLENAAVESPEHPEVYFLFAQIALAEGHLTDAHSHLEKASQLAPPKHWPKEQVQRFQLQLVGGRAMVSELRQNWPAAQKELEEWVRLDPASGAALQRLASAVFRAESTSGDMLARDSKVMKILLHACELDSKLDPPEITLASLHSSAGNHRRAGELLEESAKVRGSDARVQVRYALWLLAEGKAKEAAVLAKKAADLGLDNLEQRALRGIIARQMKEFDAAERILAEVQRDFPGDLESGLQLALVLSEQPSDEKHDRAVQLTQSLLRQYPQSRDALATLGWVYFRMGKTGLAEQCLRGATQGVDSVRSDVAYYLARVLSEKGASEEATKARQALKTALDQPGLFVLKEEAREWLTKAEETPPKQGASEIEPPTASKKISP